MNDNQTDRRDAMMNRVHAYALLFFSVTAGLFGVLLFHDWGWAVAIPGILICVLTGWAAFVLLFSVSRVAEGQKADEIEALFTDLPDTTQPVPATRIEAEQESVSVGLASGLGALAMLLIGVMGLIARNEKRDKQNPHQNANQQVQQKYEKLPGYDLSEAEEKIMLDAIVRGAKVYTDKDKKHVTALDFSSTQRIDDALLDQYSRDLLDLRILDLRNTPVTDSGVRHLATLLALRRLRLGGTSVTPEQISALRMALPECVIDTEKDE